MSSWIVIAVVFVQALSGCYGVVNDECVKAANGLRSLHENTGDLEWDDKMASEAQDYANELLHTIKKLQHSSGPYGENLYYHAGAAAGTCSDANKMWYAEIDNYDYATGTSSNGGVIGHFTQLVWKGSTKFGIGIATGPYTFKGYPNFPAKETYIVARFTPPGNLVDSGSKVQAAYIANVLPCKAGNDCSASGTKKMTW